MLFAKAVTQFFFLFFTLKGCRFDALEAMSLPRVPEVEMKVQRYVYSSKTMQFCDYGQMIPMVEISMFCNDYWHMSSIRSIGHNQWPYLYLCAANQSQASTSRLAKLKGF